MVRKVEYENSQTGDRHDMQEWKNQRGKWMDLKINKGKNK